jgi:hypothetical protein
MGLATKQEVFPSHTNPVVDHLNATASALFDKHFNEGTPGINSIIEQFPNQRCRPVNNLSCSYLTGFFRGKELDLSPVFGYCAVRLAMQFRYRVFILR